MLILRDPSLFGPLMTTPLLVNTMAKTGQKHQNSTPTLPVLVDVL
jgi:hypothetical protein